MNFRWLGPRRILDAESELVYKVSKLDRSSVENVHAARQRLYKPQMEGTVLSKELMDLVERTEARYELMENLMVIGEDADGIQIHVQWLGLPDQRDRTWVPLLTLLEDAPEMLTSFSSMLKKKKALGAKANQHVLEQQ